MKKVNVGIIGGAVVAAGMDVNFLQYILQTQGAVDWVDIATGLIKSIFFGILIALAGCQAGIYCGRNSDAVGMAAYTMDSHNCQRLVVNGMVKNEGNVEIGGFGPYPVRRDQPGDTFRESFNEGERGVRPCP